MRNKCLYCSKFQIRENIPFNGSPEAQMQRKLRLFNLRIILLYKFGRISVNFARRAMKPLFLERKLNFASNAIIFGGLRFLNLSQNLREFYFFAYVARDFFADSALFCLELFRGTHFRKIRYCD